MRRPDITDSAFRVGAFLCDSRNSKTGLCNPSIPLISAEINLSERCVKTCIKTLAKAGFIEILEKGNGSGKRSRYEIRKEAINAPFADEKGATDASFTDKKGANDDMERVQMTTAKGANGDSPFNEEPVNKPVKGTEGEEKPKEPEDPRMFGDWYLPDHVDLGAWLEFEQHRRHIRHPLNKLSRTKAANSLLGYSIAAQQAAIDQTIQNNWRGLFPWKVKDRLAETGNEVLMRAAI